MVSQAALYSSSLISGSEGADTAVEEADSEAAVLETATEEALDSVLELEATLEELEELELLPELPIAYRITRTMIAMNHQRL